MNQKLKGKRILILVPEIKPLNTQIVDTLRNLGAEVESITDILFPYNPISKVGIMHGLRKVIYRFKNYNHKYHSNFKYIWGGKWDYFICFNGFSLQEDFVKILRTHNPSIKCFLYLWDSLNIFRFEKNFLFFDKAYSFDLQDSQQYGIEYLPLFWVPSNIDQKRNPLKKKYEISFIGKLHSDRYEFIKKIEAECNAKDISYYFKIIITDKGSRLIELLRHITFEICHFFSQKRDYRYEIVTEKIKDPILSFDYIPFVEVENIIKNSNVILDIQLPNQTGYTNRMIQSLSEGKIVLTTNTINENDKFFFGKDSIIHIDRITPCLNTNIFLEKKNSVESKRLQDSLNSLRIDNWLLMILDLYP